jgi:hypothetical protein
MKCQILCKWSHSPTDFLSRGFAMKRICQDNSLKCLTLVLHQKKLMFWCACQNSCFNVHIWMSLNITFNLTAGAFFLPLTYYYNTESTINMIMMFLLISSRFIVCSHYKRCFKRSFTALIVYINLFRGHLLCFELS